MLGSEEIIAMKRRMGQIGAHMKKINVLSASEDKQNSLTKCAWNLQDVVCSLQQPWLTRSRTQVLLPHRVKGQGWCTIFHSWPGRAPGVGNDAKSSLFSRNKKPYLRTW